MELEDRVDRVWAEQFGLELGEVRQRGVRVVVDPPGFAGYAGCYFLQLGDACLVAAHPRLAASVMEAVAEAAPENVFSEEVVAAWAERHGGRVLGPSWHGYLRAADARVEADGRARPLSGADDGALDTLRAAVGEDDWAEGGFVPTPEVLWGIDDERGLAAVGNLTDFDGAPADVGLVTRPDARGRGLGLEVAASMCAASPAGRLLRYRALTTNRPSLRIAELLGFRGHGANMAVRVDL